MAQAVRLAINPNDGGMGYVLWDNGRIDAFGGAIPITGTPTDFTTVPPAGTFGPIRAIQITDWDAPGGYILGWTGLVQNFGNAGAVTGQGAGTPFVFPVAVDFAMDPAANGQGYVLLASNVILPLSGASAVTAPPFLSLGSPGQTARRILMNWADGRFYTMGGWGSFYNMDGATAITEVAGVTIAAGDPVTAGFDAYRAFVIADWDAGTGYIMNLWGNLAEFNGFQQPSGVPIWNGQDLARDQYMVFDGTGVEPLTGITLNALGAHLLWVTSNPPTVTVIAPVDPVTDTTRPTVIWQYADPENDGQQGYVVKVFDSATFGGGGFDPATSVAVWSKTVTAGAFNVSSAAITIDLANDTYRAYVRVTDTSELNSTWEFIEWTQDVTLPPTPTLTCLAGATVSDGIALDATVLAVDEVIGAVFGFQFLDSDDTSNVWRWVTGGIAITPDVIGPNLDAGVVDFEAPAGVERCYRAVYYVTNGTSTIASAFSVECCETLGTPGEGGPTGCDCYLFTDPADSTRGGVVNVKAPFVLKRTTVGGTFQPSGRAKAIVVTDGAPKSNRGTLTLIAADRAMYDLISELYESDRTLLLRDPFGHAYYLRIVGDTTITQLFVPPLATETTPVGDAHEFALPVVEVDRPVTGVAIG